MKLGEVCEIVMGQSPKGDTYNHIENGYPLLNGPTEFGAQHPNCTLWTTSPKKMCQTGDLIFCVRGSTTGRMNWADQPYCLGRGVGAFRAKTGKQSDNRFIFYQITMRLKSLLAQSNGSVFPNLNISDFYNFEIDWPNSENRLTITSLLGALDDKIENNRQLNETLEVMARAIFKSWFVDFEPVHAKAAGNTPAHMDTKTATLFPSSFDDDGLPKGWKESKFEDLIEFKNGYAFKSKELSKDVKTNFAILKMGHIKVGGGLNENYKTDYLISEASPKMEKYILETGDILMSMTDMKDNVRLLGHTALFYKQNVNFLVNQRVGLIKAKKEISNFPYIYCLTNNKTFLYEIRKRANSGVQVNLSTDGIKTTPTIIPPLSLMVKFGSLTHPIFESIFNSSKENQTLASLRDTLLAKLMSGEIHVKEADREVEAAV